MGSLRAQQTSRPSGSLFGEPEPAGTPAGRSEQASDSDLDDLTDARLSAERSDRASVTDSDITNDSIPPARGTERASDEPAWAHHSQVSSDALTPMLRHYVELKAAHPERVLLYRLGISSSASLRTRSSSRVLLTLTGKGGQGHRPYPWPASPPRRQALLQRPDPPRYPLRSAISRNHPCKGPAETGHHAGAHPRHGAG